MRRADRAALGRRADPLIWLGLASAVMVGHDPTAIRDLSFLLSCAATFGVLVVAPWLAKRAMRLRLFRAVPRLTELLAVAVGAQLMTEPIILHAFGRASLISPLVNLIVEPFVPPIMALGALTSLLSLLPFSLPATVAGICTALPASLFLAIVRWAAHFPASAVRLPQPGLALTTPPLCDPGVRRALECADSACPFRLEIARHGARCLPLCRNVRGLAHHRTRRAAADLIAPCGERAARLHCATWRVRLVA